MWLQAAIIWQKAVILNFTQGSRHNWEAYYKNVKQFWRKGVFITREIKCHPNYIYIWKNLAYFTINYNFREKNIVFFSFEKYFTGFLYLKNVHFDTTIVIIAVTEANIGRLIYFGRPFWKKHAYFKYNKVCVLGYIVFMVLRNLYTKGDICIMTWSQHPSYALNPPTIIEFDLWP